MEYVYKISAISIDDLVKSRKDLEKRHEPFLHNPSYGRVHYYNAADVIKDEYLTYLDINWSDIVVFGKNSKCVGTLHKDGGVAFGQTWALNWVWGENCILDYWEEQDISSVVFEGKYGGTRSRAETDKPPTKTYIMEPGVYLVNTEEFHRPATSGPGMRYTVSIRSSNPRFDSWKDVVNHFSNIIISR